VKLSLFEDDLSNGFNWTDQEQEAIASLISVKVKGDRLIYHDRYEHQINIDNRHFKCDDNHNKTRQGYAKVSSNCAGSLFLWV
jgi:hypothetical protein